MKNEMEYCENDKIKIGNKEYKCEFLKCNEILKNINLWVT